MIRFLFASLIVTLTMAVSANEAAGQDVDFVEKFALATDREAVLSELVPGTEQYYFYHVLHLQNTQQFDKAFQMIDRWRDRRQDTALLQEMINRQYLLTYSNNPEKSVDYLINHLRVKFNHQRKQPSAEPGLPTVLDQSLISFERLNKRGLSRNDLHHYEDIAMLAVAAQKLNDTQLRNLLGRLSHPAVPDLPALINRDLSNRNASSFGSFPVHNMLTRKQLDELKRLRPRLGNEQAFVFNYLKRLQPGNDTFVGLDRDENVAYMDRLWDFVAPLNPAWNSLKACVLYRRLELDRQMGVYDKARFIEYLKLPRRVGYVPSRIIDRVRSSNHIVDLSANYHSQIRLGPIGSDEPLVRHYLHHFLVDAADTTEFTRWLTSSYLKERFAESKITAGLGDAEQWVSQLSPTYYQQLMKRIDLEFAYTNPYVFDVDEKVEVKLTTKNIKNLIVKVFEINTANFYRTHSGEIDTNINLDGLVPNWQRTFDYDDEPALRVERTFAFEEMDHRGVYIVDFIGSGQSSRVLVRKGQLKHIAETTSAGQAIGVLNEQNELLKDATIWIAGREYQPQENGFFVVPFSNKPGRESIILQHDGLSTRAYFNHQAESYQLTAGIHVDRESLLEMGRANVVIRPQLRVAGQPTSVKLLEKVRLVARATDLDGVESTKEFSNISLNEELESVVEILVPRRLANVDFELHGEVQVVSQGEPRKLVARQSFQVNQIDRTGTLQVAHLRQNDDGYWLAVRGKTGEARKSQAVVVKLKHRQFKDPVVVNLQSDARGQVHLGALKNITRVDVQLNGQNQRTWVFNDSDQTTYQNLNSSDKHQIEVPVDTDTSVDHFALLELRGSDIYQDRSDALKVDKGALVISPLSPGDYRLLHLESGNSQNIRVTSGDEVGAFVLGRYRTLEVRDPKPLRVEDVEVSEDKLRIQLGGDGQFARVHIMATRYQPRFGAFAGMASGGDIEPLILSNALTISGYVAGRTIGEEYQYILERQFEEKYPGNMLTRPSLLLNPWALRTTENNVQIAARGDHFGQAGSGKGGASQRGKKGKQGAVTNSDFANLNFLADGSIVIANIAPDENGMVEIDLSQFGQKHMLQIVVQNQLHTLYRQALLPESPLEFRDLRLANGLDPERHFAQQKQYTVLKAGEQFQLDDAATAKFQRYDNLADIYRYYVTLTGNQQLVAFGFLMDWPQKSDEEKLELYKRHACHEFNFFLLKKDRDYFNSVIVPYLENKFHKTFLDEYLLGLELNDWAEPWEFKRLNTVEQILLGRRVDGHRPRLNQFVGDDYDNFPTSRRDFDRFYDFAVASSSLDASENKKSAELFQESAERRSFTEDAAADDDMDGAPGQGNQAPSPAKAKRLDRRSASRKQSPSEKQSKEIMRVEETLADLEKDEQSLAMLAMPRGGGGGGFGGGGGGRGRFRANRQLRSQTKQYYHRIKPTQEWVENNYYHLPIEQQNSGLVRVNRFWRDFALHTGETPFLSPFFAESSRNFTEMMLALAVIDLPFEAPEHEIEYDENMMTMTPDKNLIAFYEQVKASAFDRGETTVLISENFFRADDRYRTVDGKKRENFVRKEFLSNVLYGGQVVITNPTSTPQEIDLLVQIPEGAVPASSSHETKTSQMDMPAFSTQTLEYYFYFPTPGDFGHFPAHVSIDAATVAAAEGLRFNVVEELSEIDTGSWAWISQNGSEQQVLDFLSDENVQAVDLGQIAFRMKNKEFYGKVISLLSERFAYHGVLWSYSLKHGEANHINEYLENHASFPIRCGLYLDSPLLDVKPVIRHMYQHREYWPLVNARAHQLGNTRKILNNAIWKQYYQLLHIIARQNKPGDEAKLAVAYYLLLQDRVTDAIAFFDRVSADKINSKLQYDYCAAYVAMYLEKPDQAAQIAKRYSDHPVKRWRELFAAVSAQVDEINGANAKIVDSSDQNQRQTASADETPGFDFKVEALTTRLNYQNLDSVTIKYYQMDVELLFSRNPFVQKQDDSFAMIKPNTTEVIQLPAELRTFEVKLPEQFHTSNVLVEVTGGGKTTRQAYYANTMNVQTIEQYGQVKVSKNETNKLLSKVYVKVYARMADESVKFYKDGYTDLRGRFDYASLSNQNLNDVEQFAILILSPEHGAVVREATPPKQ